MTAPDFWEVLNRGCNTGVPTNVRDFDMKIFTETSRLVKEYDIKYDPSVYVPDDDTLADDVWKAGLELFLSVGMYCMDSRRVIKFDDFEVKSALSQVDHEVEIGTGNERCLVKRRGISPLEVHSGRRMAAWVREALRRARRPGLHFISACPSAIADIAACSPEHGVRQTDGLMVSVIAELKTDYEALGKVAYAIDYGCIRATHGGSVIGGWAGGPEGATIVSIADFLGAVMVYQHNVGPVYGDHGLTRNPGTVPTSSFNPGMWGTELTGQAIARNYRGVNGRFFLTAAGPGTEMQLWEVSALCIAGMASGRDLFCGGGIRRYKVRPMLGSALENRFHAELGHSVTGIKRSNANELVKQIVKKYRDKITKDGGPWGHTFNEMYDLNTLEPRPKYVELYSRVKNELGDMGIDFKY